MNFGAALLYKYRWILSILVVTTALVLMWSGAGQLGDFSAKMESLHEKAGAKDSSVEPRIFDSRYDIWFRDDDPALEAYQHMEDTFLAEDFVLVGFEEPDHQLGVFSPESLETIARLTRALEERVPYVRNVRSLTSNPWIRWGEIEGSSEDNAVESQSGSSEEGMLITDLFENAPSTYSESEVIERMIAVLGGTNTSQLVGHDRVLTSIGKDVDLADYVGEPRLHENIISLDGRATAIAVQLIRSPPESGKLIKIFGDNFVARRVAPEMHITEAHAAALKGIRNVLAAEKGLVVDAVNIS